ncbi:MAG: hypothetical protein V3S51_07425 [Dehalococcoidia bacterium]
MAKETELWGRKFKIVKNGLDEKEVSAFVDSLKSPSADIPERLERLNSLLSSLTERHDDLLNRLGPLDSLAEVAENSAVDIDNQKLEQLDTLIVNLTEKSQDLAAAAESSGIAVDNEKLEHLDSLTRLAESTIVEAEKQAESIGAEIEGKAQEKAANIVSEAEERAKAEEERMIAEAKDKAETEEERMIAEAKDKAESEAERIIAEAEERAEQIRSTAEEEASNILAQARQKAEVDSQVTRQEAEQLLSRSKQEVEGEIKGMFDQAYQRLLANFQGPRGTTPSSTGAESGTSELAELDSFADGHDDVMAEEPQEEPGISQEERIQPESEGTTYEQEELESEQSQEQPTFGQAAGGDAELKEAAYEQGEATAEEGKVNLQENPDLYEGVVELAIPAPVGLDQVMQIHKDFKQVPQVKVLNFGGSVDKGITIRLISHAPAPLLDIFAEMSAVEKALDESQVSEKQVPSRPQGDGPPIRRIIITTRS